MPLPGSDTLVDAFEARRGGGQAVAHLLVGSAVGADEALAALEKHVAAAGSAYVVGAWRSGFERPFGGLLALVECLAEVMTQHAPGWLRRYRFVLANLLPAWRHRELLAQTRILSSGLARFALHDDTAGLKDFYWRRDETAALATDLIRLVIDAVGEIAERDDGSPVVVVLEGIDLADRRTVDTIRLLVRAARHAPIWICATATEEPLATLISDDTAGLWTRSRQASKSESTARSGKPFETVDDVVAVAAVAVFPVDVASIVAAGLGAEPRAIDLDRLVAARLLRRVGTHRVTVASKARQEAVYQALSETRRGQLHEACLQLEGDDPYAALWHAEASGALTASRVAAALEAAWSVSDFAAAARFASRGAGESDSDQLQGLLSYDSGEYEATERHLKRAIDRRGEHDERYYTLTQLAGYNLIFGRGELDRGRSMLERVLEHYIVEGRDRESLLLRNSIAFALFRVGRFDDAIELETVALDLLARATGNASGGLLVSILQLNLGRLYRRLGFTEKALALFRESLEAPDADVSPFVLLLLYSSLAHLHEARGETANVVWYLGACIELSLDLDLENVGYPVLNLLERGFEVKLDDRLARGDVVLFHLYLSLAVWLRRLGLDDRTQQLLDAMRGRWDDLGADVWRAVEARLEAAEPVMPTPARSVPQQPRLPRLLRYEPLPTAVTLASRIADGAVVAVARGHVIGDGVDLPDSVVLFDPCSATVGRQLARELGVASGYYPPSSGQSPSGACAALVLPSASTLFRGAPRLGPLILHDVTLDADSRNELAGLVPFHLRVRALTAELDGFLFEVLSAFAAQTGVQALGALPFHLRRRPLALEPRQAIHAFLASSVSHLVLDDQLVEKRHGASSVKNLLPFRPALSRHVRVLEPNNGDSSIRLRLRLATSTSELKLRAGVLPLLELCDGQHTVAELVEHQRAGTEQLDLELQIGGFIRQLWHQGVVTLADPASVVDAGDR
ncbi:MAG: hypothetical protein AAGD38_14370 [Acidobacteriota bacterium]